jgi:3-methyladenine DNA glycosylase/8-oxoguanine DNA glycosylase
VLQTLTDEQFRSVGVSPQKLASLRDLTQKTLDGTLCFRRISQVMDEEAIAELVQVRGIGRWTAQMYLMFSLGRPDIFAPDDLGLRRAIAKLYDLPDSPKRQHFEDLSEMWSPWRSVASWYLWRSLEWSDAQNAS